MFALWPSVSSGLVKAFQVDNDDGAENHAETPTPCSNSAADADGEVSCIYLMATNKYKFDRKRSG